MRTKRAAQPPKQRGQMADKGRQQAEAVREKRAARIATRRLAMERAALELAGEIGYAQLTVDTLLKRSSCNRSDFYSSYRNKDQCFAAGYAATLDQLVERLLSAGSTAPSWADGLRAALGEFAEFLAAEPDLARGLLAEVYVAGEAALAKRKEVVERLSRAIDRARRETDESRHSPPPITSTFILNAIESIARRAFLADEPQGFAADVPGLVFIAVAAYFGTEAAEEDQRRHERR
jgi:AcrR family transcriptional regulator